MLRPSSLELRRVVGNEVKSRRTSVGDPRRLSLLDVADMPKAPRSPRSNKHYDSVLITTSKVGCQL